MNPQQMENDLVKDPLLREEKREEVKNKLPAQQMIVSEDKKPDAIIDIENKIEEEGYAIVYIWNSKKFLCLMCSCGKSCGCPCCHDQRVGHVSMRLVKNDGTPLPNGYISMWPDVFHDDYAQDFKAEENQLPTRKIVIHKLNINAIYEEFKKMKESNHQWSFCGSGFFKSARQTNCSGLVSHLLIRHGKIFNEEFFNQQRDCVRKCIDTMRLPFLSFDPESARHNPPSYQYEKMDDIVEVLNAKQDCWSYTKRLLWFISPLILLSAYAGIINLVVINLDKEEDKIGASIGLIVFFLIFMCSCCDKIIRASYFIGNCGGVTPDDVNFLLNYLIIHPLLTRNRIEEINVNEVGYKIEYTDQVVQRMVPKAVLQL